MLKELEFLPGFNMGIQNLNNKWYVDGIVLIEKKKKKSVKDQRKCGKEMWGEKTRHWDRKYCWRQKEEGKMWITNRREKIQKKFKILEMF